MPESTFGRRFGAGSISPHYENVDNEFAGLYGTEAMTDECGWSPASLRSCDGKPASGVADQPQQSIKLRDSTRFGSSCPEDEAGELWLSSGPAGFEILKGKRRVPEQMSMRPCQEDDGHRNWNRHPVFGQDVANFEGQGRMWLMNPEIRDLRRVDSALSQTEVLSVTPNSGASALGSDYISQQDDADRVKRIREASSLVDLGLNQNAGDVQAYGSAIAAETCSLPEISRTPGICGANPFAPDGPFRACPPCPTLAYFQFPDRHSASVVEHAFMSSEENASLNFGVPVPDCCVPLDNEGLSSLGTSSLGSLLTNAHENSCKEKHTSAPDVDNPGGEHHIWARLGGEAQQQRTKSKSNKASSRLARKGRMDRTRRPSLLHATRGVLSLGQDCGVGSSRSQNSSCVGGQSEASTREEEDREDLQFLLQKELKPSDVGALGRIVIPKKDAEGCLPRLVTKEGVDLDCEDYDTGEKIMLRFRYWPNNKSRMYLLQNTGDFVKTHQLRQDDKMLLYRNRKVGTYIIRARLGRREDIQHEDVTEGKCSEETSGTGAFSPCASNAEASEPSSSSGVEVVKVSDPRTGDSDVGAHRTDLMCFADLPHVAMGENMENLVTFPSLEFGDVDSIEF